MSKSTYTKSLAHDTYKVRPNLHIGMQTKPLEPYNPTSFRNRLPVPDPKMPATNASSIEFGDRNQKYNRHFLSVAKNVYGNFGTMDPVTNSGILAERTKWHHYLQHK